MVPSQKDKLGGSVIILGALIAIATGVSIPYTIGGFANQIGTEEAIMILGGITIAIFGALVLRGKLNMLSGIIVIALSILITYLFFVFSGEVSYGPIIAIIGGLISIFKARGHAKHNTATS
ncbi:MAG: hypothetical protein ACP5MX_03915 [Candidatus Micrarchaeia archaeon]